MRCASVGVKRLHVAGSARRSYTAAGHVVCTDKFCAKTIRRPFPPGVEADRMGWIGVVDLRTGAEALRVGLA